MPDRRTFLASIGAVTATGLAGCGSDSGGSIPVDDDTPAATATPTAQTPEWVKVCTDAKVTNIEHTPRGIFVEDFNWEGVWLSEDKFTGTLVSEADRPARVKIRVQFYNKEDVKIGSFVKERSIDAGATKTIALRGNPPSDAADAMVMQVVPGSQAWVRDEFTGTLVNQADVAGTVAVTLEAGGEQTTREVAIGAQATKDVTIKWAPPSGTSRYTMRVTDQECERKRAD